ncbi:site-specific integrase [Agrococcus sp. SL85]|uniref:tyrosine-type recombinase/integrase n=1 Tax=Agrococcus sp. SL85 TaxID=2995141 RepID=UPI00226CB8B4|nr:site-specific integrase [Agrococcus sp. SL85]WAC65752.1 site-specific integrase [Agrococcus sp. SL85]
MSNVQKRPNGSWRARYRDADGRDHARHFPRKIDAQRWLDEVTASIVTGRYVDPSKARTTLEEFYDDWSQRQLWATGTHVAMRRALTSCTFSDRPLASLRRSHVEAWVKSMVQAGLAPSTIRTRVMNVRAMLRAAVRDRALAEDPAEGVPLPRLRRREHAMTIPAPETVWRVVDGAPEWFRLYVALCAFAGLRVGETSGVQLGDVDFLRRQLHVQRQIQRDETGAVQATPPKHGSERTVSLPDELVEMIAWHVEHVGVRGSEQWLFMAKTGEPPLQDAVGNRWRRLLDELALERFRLHDLRHFYASGLIAAGCDVVTVQRALGHAKASTTLNTYSHLWPSAEDKTRAAAAGMMRESRGLPADRTAESG